MAEVASDRVGAGDPPPREARLAAAWDQALRLAWESFRAGTTPVGAVVIAADGSVKAAGRGRRFELRGPAGQLAGSHIAHAEINALAQLSSSRRWEDHRLLSTLEPCGMCHGAAAQTNIGAVTFAAPDPYAGTATLQFDTPKHRRRSPLITGPLPDARGAFATLLHLVWLMGTNGNEHVIAVHEHAMPGLSAYARRSQAELMRASAADDYPSAFALAAAAPW